MGRTAVLLAAGTLLALASPAFAGEERSVVTPSGAYHMPAYRAPAATPRLVVCKADSADRIERLDGPLRDLNRRLLRECSYRDIQAAVNAVTQRGTTIYVLPGRYREEPSREAPAGQCERLAGRDVLLYAEQRACPNLQSLIGIFGDEHPEDPYDVCDGPRCDLQLEGTGGKPDDVLVDGGYARNGEYAKRTGIRADRADGFYVRNLTTRRFGTSGIGVVQTDGFVLERVVARESGENGLAAHAGDHGMFTDCATSGSGGAGIVTTAASDLRGARTSIEVRRCRSQGNLLGFSGSAGDSIYLHENEFTGNAAGVAMDSATPNQNGQPQNHALLVANRIHANNVNPYRHVWAGTCAEPPADRGRDVVCPVTMVPVGTGLLLAGGDDNTFVSNLIYDNWRYGAAQYWVPATLRGEDDPANYRDTSHGNRYLGNLMGFSPAGGAAPNGVDFWWDEQGDRNCWRDNASAWGVVRSEPRWLPDCADPSGGGPYSGYGNPDKTSLVLNCAEFDLKDRRPPKGCDWLDTPSRPGAPHSSVRS